MSQNRIVKRGIAKALTAAISDLGSGPRIISGSLTVAPGHDYWWFLEFGTGEFHEPDSSYDQLIGTINPPREVAAHNAAGGAYDITVTEDQPYLVYMTMAGVRKRIESTVHPGIKPMGFVRSALFDAEIHFEEDLIRLRGKLKQGKRLPKREELVRIINYTLEVLVGQIKLQTPLDSDPDPYHQGHRPHSPTLAKAWGLTRAK